MFKVIGSMGQIHQYDLREFKGRVFFTTDLHGAYDLLHEKLREVAFDTKKDLLFVGGDWCDRGPDSYYVLDYLDEPWIVSIQANHEDIFIGAYEEGFDSRLNYSDCLFSNGGDWVRSITNLHAKAIYDAFKSLPLAIEILLPNETVGIIHAEVPYQDWERFKVMRETEYRWDGRNTAQWGRDKYRYQNQNHIANIDRVLVGHTPTNSGEIEVLGNVWYCDLGSHFRDKISMLEVN